MQILWIAILAIASFLLTYVTVDRLSIARDAFVLCHIAITGSLLSAHARSSRIGMRELVGNWRLGLAGALVAGSIMTLFVLRGPSSPARRDRR